MSIRNGNHPFRILTQYMCAIPAKPSSLEGTQRVILLVICEKNTQKKQYPTTCAESVMHSIPEQTLEESMSGKNMLYPTLNQPEGGVSYMKLYLEAYLSAPPVMTILTNLESMALD